MSPATSQTTRLLCASAFLAGAQFRERILSHFEHESRGTSPELGVDTKLVVMVCQYAKNRVRRFEMHLFFALVAGLIASAVVGWFFGISVFLLAAAAIHYKMTIEEKVHLAPMFRQGEFDETEVRKLFAVRLEAKVAAALPCENQNLIVYTGFTPFVGAGAHLGGWSFVVDLSKTCSAISDPAPPLPFKVEELYSAMRSGIKDSCLEGLSIKDFYFVNGQQIRADREILPDIYGRPEQHLNHEHAQKLLSRSDARIRHYMWVRIHDWNQELITSYFIRFSIRGRSLFVEINRCLLTPLSAAYRSVDAMTPLQGGDFIGILIASAFVGSLYALLTPFLLLLRLNEAAEKSFGGRERARRESIDKDPLFDYGAGQGHRQALSSRHFYHFYQKADSDFCTKALESIILDEIISFLDDHYVDTSNLRERQNMILNSGIIVQGGDVMAESLAVGSGAKAIKALTRTRKASGASGETA